jgi:hypothetical protein
MNPLVNALVAGEQHRDLRRAIACCAEVLEHHRAALAALAPHRRRPPHSLRHTVRPAGCCA